MTIEIRRPMLAALALALMLGGLVGCQTWVPEPGITLPTGRYLDHPPQYIPPSPPFPLSRELASQEATAAAVNVRPEAVPPPPGQ